MASGYQRAVDQLLRDRLGMSLADWIREQMTEDPKVSMESLARRLDRITDGAGSVSYQTMGRWVAELVEGAAPRGAVM